MSTSAMLTSAPAKSPLRLAMENRDHGAAVESFASDAEFHSPFTEKLTFKGRRQIAALVRVVLDVFPDLRYTEELLTKGAGILVADATVEGRRIEIVDHLRFGPDGKIVEMTVFFRPLPAAAIALRLIGAGLVRPRSRLRAAILSALARPLGFLTGAGDGIGVWFVRSAL